ncbi:bifunctional 2',3'-cyclic-nucleotide 2'-phosphodiesterase/3'-nucleotidase [Salibacterium sp. K-3]
MNNESLAAGVHCRCSILSKIAAAGILAASGAGLMFHGSAGAENGSDSTVQLRLMETTDIHMHLANYNYYTDEQTEDYGLVKTAELIKEARNEVSNSMLFDNGDLIQGNPLGEYVAEVDPLTQGETHPAYKIMNDIEYDVGNLGNHDFNYGLDYQKQVLDGAEFPYVNANVYEDNGNGEAGANRYDPYVILDRTVTDEADEEHTVKVGVIGFVPPQIMDWDTSHLTGEVVTEDIVKTAEKFVPEMKEEGADVIAAVPHSGFGTMEDETFKENATSKLTTVDGIDAVMFGHDHAVFPGEDFQDYEWTNVDKGTINGTPSVMPGKWGERLGIIDLTLEQVEGDWEVVDGTSETRQVTEEVERDNELYQLIEEEHENTLDYVRDTIGETTAPMHSYFAQVADDPSIQIVTNAQKWYLEQYIQGTEYDGTPVLSAGAPFKAGSRGDPSDYTDIPAGELAIQDAANLYLYDNTLQAVYLDGKQVKEWLEMSAGQFNTIDSASSEKQQLINMDFRSYNFDVIDGVEYKIDVTEEPRYDADGNLINENTERIVDLTYEGEPVTEDDHFLVATNNYRATGNFPGLNGENTVIESPDENRQIVIDYIKEQGTINPSADNNWSFSPVEGEASVVFESSPEGRQYVDTMENISYEEELNSGFAEYSIELEGKSGNNNGPSEDEPKDALPDTEVYTVKPGDTLFAIGEQHGVDWSELAEYNDLDNPDYLQIGQKIKIPE